MDKPVIDLDQIIFEPKNYYLGIDKPSRRECKMMHDLDEMKIINHMLHDMVRIQDNDTGMRICLHKFNKAPSKNAMIKHNLIRDCYFVSAREMIETESDFIKTKTYNLFCEDSKLQITVRGRYRKNKVNLSTVEFTIDEIDEGIRNQVMGWFE